jgi:hypothetical protein
VVAGQRVEAIQMLPGRHHRHGPGQLGGGQSGTVRLELSKLVDQQAQMYPQRVFTR